jgi:hypothetical protein
MNSEGRKLGHCGKLDVDLVQEKRLRVGGTVVFHMLPNQRARSLQSIRFKNKPHIATSF